MSKDEIELRTAEKGSLAQSQNLSNSGNLTTSRKGAKAPRQKTDDVSVFRTVNITDSDTLVQTEQLLGEHKAFVYSRLKTIMSFNGDEKKIKDQITSWEKEKPDFWQEKGAVGENLLHLCMLPNKSGVIEPNLRPAVFALVDRIPTLARVPYEIGDLTELPQDSPYEGETPLHMAIVVGDYEVAKFLLKHGAEVRGVETKGRFFLPPAKGGKVYYGGTPVNFAVANLDDTIANPFEILELLYEKDQDCLNTPDTEEHNTPLHMAILCHQPLAYDWLRKKGAKIGKKIVNRDGLTPLSLAAALGNKQMLDYLMEYDRKNMWSYGPISVNLYPKEYLESTLEAIRVNRKRDLLTNRVIWQHLNNKWNAFGRRTFWKTFLMGFLYLIVFFFTVALKPKTVISVYDSTDSSITYFYDFQSMYDVSSQRSSVYGRWALQIFMGLCLIYWFGMQFLSIYRWGLKRYFQITGWFQNLTGWGHALFWILSIGFQFALTHSCTYTDHACQYRSDDNIRTEHLSLTEDILLSISSLLGWLHLLTLYRAFRPVGQFGVILYRMFFLDIGRFISIYLLVLLGFGQVFYTLFPFKPSENDNTFPTDRLPTIVPVDSFPAESGLAWDDPNIPYRSIARTMVTLFLASFGDFRFESFDVLIEFGYARGVAATLFFIGYVVIVTLLMLNLLIAMMGSTFQQIESQAESEWRLQWADVVQYMTIGVTKRDKEKNYRKLNYVPEEYRDGDTKKVVWWMMVEEVNDDFGVPTLSGAQTTAPSDKSSFLTNLY